MRRFVGGVLKVMGALAGVAYYLLCLAGFAQNLGGGWFLAALFIPPLDLAYPFVHLWQFDVFPWGLSGIGAGSMVLFWVGAWIAGSLREELQQRDRIVW